MKIVGMKLQITTHRLIFSSNTHHSLLVKGENISDVGISVNFVVLSNLAFLVKTIL
jgi:hypothetical protein